MMLFRFIRALSTARVGCCLYRTCIGLIGLAVVVQVTHAAGSVREVSSEKTTAAQAQKKKTSKPATNTANLVPVNDAELANVYHSLDQGKLSLALEQIDAILVKAPNYKLAHLVKADVLNAKAFRPAPTFSATEQKAAFGDNEISRRLTELRAEAHLRMFAIQYQPNPKHIPSTLLHIDKDIPRVVVGDSIHSRLYVYENGPDGLHLKYNYYMTQGKFGSSKEKEGDLKTPIGVYYSDGAIDKKLPDLYGYGALNTDYPNVWDKKHERTGYGIWLHGTPSNTYARAPYASDGCVVLTNADLAQLFPLITPKVPIYLAESIQFVEPNETHRLKHVMMARMKEWVDLLKDADVKQLSKMYAPDFAPDVNIADEVKDGKTNLDVWMLRKAQYAKSMGNVLPTIKSLIIVSYPGEQNLIHTKFELHYPTDKKLKTSTILYKTLYWKKINNKWVINLETLGSN